MKTAKKISFYILLTLLISLACYHIGYQVTKHLIPIPSGEWELLMDSDRPTFGNISYNYPQIILSEIYPDIYFSVKDGFIWKCNLETQTCSKTDFETAPIDHSVLTLTHDVQNLEIPSYPSGHANVIDVLRISRLGGEYILNSYFLLMSDGTIWTWSYYDSTRSLLIEIESIAIGILSALGGLITTIIVINKTEKKRKSKNSA